jgi:hypothetical protein
MSISVQKRKNLFHDVSAEGTEKYYVTKVEKINYEAVSSLASACSSKLKAKTKKTKMKFLCKKTPLRFPLTMNFMNAHSMN